MLCVSCPVRSESLKEALPSVSHTGDPTRFCGIGTDQWSQVAPVEPSESQNETNHHDSKKGVDRERGEVAGREVRMEGRKSSSP